MVGLPDGETILMIMFIRFDTIHERDRQTERQTHTLRHRMATKAALGASIAQQKKNEKLLDARGSVRPPNLSSASGDFDP